MHRAPPANQRSTWPRFHQREEEGCGYRGWEDANRCGVRDSRELFFVSDARKFYVVRVPESGPSPDIEPTFLFDMHANVSATRNSYVPSLDGQRFLVNQVLDTEDAPINVISNWAAGIK